MNEIRISDDNEQLVITVSKPDMGTPMVIESCPDCQTDLLVVEMESLAHPDLAPIRIGGCKCCGYYAILARAKEVLTQAITSEQAKQLSMDLQSIEIQLQSVIKEEGEDKVHVGVKNALVNTGDIWRELFWDEKEDCRKEL